MEHTFFVPSSVDEYLGWSHFIAILNNAAIYMGLYFYVEI